MFSTRTAFIILLILVCFVETCKLNVEKKKLQSVEENQEGKG
jgi:hypothetical protein